MTEYDLHEPKNTAPVADDEIDLAQLWFIFKKSRKQIIKLCLVAVFLAGIITYFFIPKKYQSSVTFYLEEQNSGGALSMLSGQLGALGGMLPAFLGGGGAKADLCSEIVLARQFLREILKAEKLPNTQKDIAKFRKQVIIAQQKKSGTLTISTIADSPLGAYRLTKRIFAHYRKVVEEQVYDNNSYNRRFLEEQLNKTQKRLERAEQELLTYQKQKEMILLPEVVSKVIEDFADLEKQKIQTEIALHEAERRLTRADSLLKNEAADLNPAVVESVNIVLQEYQGKLTEIELGLAKARENLTDQHPSVKNLLAERQELLAKIKGETATIHSQAVAEQYLLGLADVTGLEARMNSLNSVYAAKRKLMNGMPDELLNYAQLVREQKVAEQVFILLVSQLEQAKFAESKDENVKIQVIDAPVVPYKKHSPSTTMNMAISGVLALFIGVGWAFYREKGIGFAGNFSKTFNM